MKWLQLGLYIGGFIVMMSGAVVFRYTDIWFLPGFLLGLGFVMAYASGQIKEALK